MHAAEMWTLTQTDRRRLEAFEMWTWRRIERSAGLIKLLMRSLRSVNKDRQIMNSGNGNIDGLAMF